MFNEERTELLFDWSMIGDIDEGRPNLGNSMNVSLYRLMQFTLRDVMIKELGVAQAGEIFFKAGEKAGIEFYKNLLQKNLVFSDFVRELQEKMSDLKIGILRVEKADLEEMEFTLTVAEDLDCSGLPMTDEVICDYDEGFIAGILSSYTGLPFEVKEVDCWCSGERVCRFEAKAL